jgi:polyphosphate kinase
MSENIRVRSILGRYLEHSRIFYFENATQSKPKLYIGSADWMARNFYRRIEVTFPVEQDDLRNRIINDILNVYLKDTRFTTELMRNGSYRRIKSRGDPNFSSQQFFIEEAIQSSKTAELAAKDEES